MFYLDVECRRIKNSIQKAYNEALTSKPAIAETLKAHSKIPIPEEVREQGKKVIRELKEKIRNEQEYTRKKEMEVRKYWSQVGRLLQDGRIWEH